MAYSTRKLSLVSEQEPAAKTEPHLSDASRPLGTVAATLRAARLAHGSTLPEISDSLRIRLAYLEAIEDGRFDELPGNVYAIGFIRTYADHLGLDSRHLIEKFKEETEQPQSQQELHFLAAEPERRIPGGSLMLVALLMA
ncbi:MAG: helix-turn-helix domain-containing protein, partial [Pseudomonadota bacterium]